MKPTKIIIQTARSIGTEVALQANTECAIQASIASLDRPGVSHHCYAQNAMLYANRHHTLLDRQTELLAPEYPESLTL